MTRAMQLRLADEAQAANDRDPAALQEWVDKNAWLLINMASGAIGRVEQDDAKEALAQLQKIGKKKSAASSGCSCRRR